MNKSKEPGDGMGVPRREQRCGKESTWHILGIASSSTHDGNRVHQGLIHFSEVNSAATEGGSGRPSQRGPWPSLCCGRLWQSGKVHGTLLRRMFSNAENSMPDKKQFYIEIKLYNKCH